MFLLSASFFEKLIHGLLNLVLDLVLDRIYSELYLGNFKLRSIKFNSKEALAFLSNAQTYEIVNRRSFEFFVIEITNLNHKFIELLVKITTHCLGHLVRRHKKRKLQLSPWLTTHS